MPKKGRSKRRGQGGSEVDGEIDHSINETFDHGGDLDDSAYDNLEGVDGNGGSDAKFEGLVQRIVQALAASGYLGQGAGGATPVAVEGFAAAQPEELPADGDERKPIVSLPAAAAAKSGLDALTTTGEQAAASRGPDARLLLKKLPIFKGGHNEDFFTWYNKVEALQGFHRLDNKSFAQYIPYTLEGAARQWLALQPHATCASAAAMMVALVDAYGHLTAMRLDERIHQAKQGWDKYACDFWYQLKCEADRMPGMFGASQLEGRWRAGLRSDLSLFMLQHTNLPWEEQLWKLHTYE
jgi:hypothetical protein